MISTILRQRATRERLFPGLAEPAWLMMLDLTANGSQPVGNLSIASFVPTTTALRHIQSLVEHGLVTRQGDATDGRRVFVHLTETAKDGLAGFEASA